jgi:uncharacterized protein
LDKRIEEALIVERLIMTNYGEEVIILGKSAENSEFQKLNNSIYQFRETLAGILILLIALPESLIYSGQFGAAILMYAAILIALSLISIFVKIKEIQNISQAFLLLPIFRLINFSMPVFSERPLLSFIFIYTPMIFPLTIIIINQKLTYEQLGLNLKNIWYYLPMAILIGLILGWLETSTIHIIPLIRDLRFINIAKVIILMIILVGIVEEIIFRSILQTRFEKTFGIWGGLILSSLLFGLMNSGYGTIYQILYTLFVGLLIGYIFQKTRSLPFIALIHGLVNVFAFGIIPNLGHGFGLL